MMDMLPNNLADFPTRKPLVEANSVSRPRLRRVAARFVVMIVVGGLVGLVAYHWAVSPEEAAPSPPANAAPVPTDAAPTPVDAEATSTAPDLVVTCLNSNEGRSQ